MARRLDGSEAQRWRLAFFIALAAAAVLILAPAAGGRGLLHPRIVELERATDAAAAAAVIARWGRTAVAVEAIRFDYAFIVAYCAALVLASIALARRLGGLWKVALFAAAACAVAAGVYDVRENGAMLAMLSTGPTDDLARLSARSANLKFALVGVAILLCLLGLVARLRRGSAVAAPSAETPTPQAVEPSGELLPCDLVMKGGITSGIAYPQAICELARHYEFRNIGGASAGAIAAGLTAAAEYARKATTPTPGLPNLEQFPQWLARPGRLLELFRPDDASRPLFEIFLAFLGDKSALSKWWRAIVSGVRSQPGWAAAGLLPGAVLGSWPYFEGATSSAVFIFIVVSLLAVPALVAVGVATALFEVLPGNWFGLCSGMAPAPAGQTDSLTRWLSDVIDRLAEGYGPDDHEANPRHQPLTFAELRSRGINFELLTTSLTHARPYRVPFETRELFFREVDFYKLFPPAVVEHMVTHSEARDDGFRPLPPPDELPVVVAVRMSLSFPILLSAVPLYAVDYNSQPQALERCWFSDGGIASNFPIHFFDRLLPQWPTFGIDLTSVQRRWVYLPQRLADGRAESWNRFTTLSGFLNAVVNAVHSWVDNRQARMPGFRDRIVRISIGPGEGGLNVDMPPAKILELAERGGVAGRLLAEQFAAPGSKGWDRHLWTRYRLLMSLLERNLPEIEPILKSAHLAGLEASPPSFELERGERELSARMRERLAELAREWSEQKTALNAEMAASAPRAPVELRVAPKV
jgi:predicted acylesterase/phospholipase RssA